MILKLILINDYYLFLKIKKIEFVLIRYKNINFFENV
jgi:hypothetical protein